MVNLTLMGACQLLSLSASPSIFLVSQTLQVRAVAMFDTSFLLGFVINFGVLLSNFWVSLWLVGFVQMGGLWNGSNLTALHSLLM